TDTTLVHELYWIFVVPFADQRDSALYGPEDLDRARLVLAEHLREDTVQPRLTRDRLGRQAVVAREHRDAHAEPLERRDDAFRLRLRHVGDGDHAEDLTGEGDVDHRLALGGEPLDTRGEDVHVDPARVHQRPVAEQHATVRRHRVDPLARYRRELAHRRQRKPALLGARDD